MDHPWMYTMDEFGETPTTRARKSGYTVLAEMLLSHDRADAAKSAPPESRPAQEKDAYWGMSHSVYKLIDDENKPSPSASDSKTPLHCAARDGNLDRVKELIASGAEVDGINEQGLTPLHIIALNGRADVAEVLIESGATINQRESYTGKLTPMAMALLMGYDDLVAVMSERGGVC